MPSDYGYPIPPTSQRPQVYSRVALEEPKELIRAKDDQYLEQSGVEQIKVKVVNQSREVLDNRFSESQVDRFRGNTEGRELKPVPPSLPISRLPNQVQAFNPLTARSSNISTFSSAESAAMGMTRERPQINTGSAVSPSSDQNIVQLRESVEERQELRAQQLDQLPSINGSGEIAARFDAIEDQIRSRALDEFTEMRPGGPESERVSLENAQVKEDYREDFVSDQKRDLNLENAVFDQQQGERRLQEDQVATRQQEAQRNDIVVNESAIQQRQTEENVVNTRNFEAPVAREPGAPTNSSGEPLSSGEQREVQRLERRDLEVKSHEQAHARVGGSHVRGGVKLSYTTGPDGQRYATSGQVNIDLSAESSPEATANKMRQVQRAALAPANPSGADRAVASLAGRRELEAQTEIRELQARDQEVRAREQIIGEPANEKISTEQAGEVEVRENIDHMAGAQSVIPDPSFSPRSSGIEQQSLEAYEASYPMSSPKETSRPVSAPSKKFAMGELNAPPASPRSESSSAQYDEAIEKALASY